MTSTLDDARGELLALADRFANAPIWQDDDDPEGFLAVDISQAERDQIVTALRAAPVPQSPDPACGNYSQASQRLNGDLQPGSGEPRCDAESVEAAARIIHPGAFDQEAGSEHQRHEAKTKAERVLALVSPPSEAGREMLDLHHLVDWVHLYATEGHSWLGADGSDRLIALAARKPTQADANALKSGATLKSLSPDHGTVAVASARGNTP